MIWWPYVAGAAATLIGGVLGSKAQEKAADKAASAQVQSTQMGIDEQKRQFDEQAKRYDEIRALLAPFIQGGTTAFTAQQNLMGLGGPEAQQQAIAGIEASPEMQAMMAQGENAILQNASATGGLRGGNTQAALAQFRPSLLSELINKRYSQLGQVAALGQSSATGQGANAAAFNQQSSGFANSMAGLYGQQGNALAAGAMGQGAAGMMLGNTLGQLGGMFAGANWGQGGAPAGGASGGSSGYLSHLQGW